MKFIDQLHRDTFQGHRPQHEQTGQLSKDEFQVHMINPTSAEHIMRELELHRCEHRECERKKQSTLRKIKGMIWGVQDHDDFDKELKIQYPCAEGFQMPMNAHSANTLQGNNQMSQDELGQTECCQAKEDTLEKDSHGNQSKSKEKIRDHFKNDHPEILLAKKAYQEAMNLGIKQVTLKVIKKFKDLLNLLKKCDKHPQCSQKDAKKLNTMILQLAIQARKQPSASNLTQFKEMVAVAMRQLQKKDEASKEDPGLIPKATLERQVETRKVLQQHMQTGHNNANTANEDPVKVSLDRQVKAKEALQKHMQTGHDNINTANEDAQLTVLLDRQVETKGVLQQHMQTGHDNANTANEDPVKVSLDRHVETKEVLQQHMQTGHDNANTANEDAQLTVSLERQVETNEVLHEYMQTGNDNAKQAKVENKIGQAQKVDHNRILEMNPRRSERLQVVNKDAEKDRKTMGEQAVEAPKKFMCSECPYKGPTKYRLTEHIETVHLKVKLQCDQCESLVSPR